MIELLFAEALELLKQLIAIPSYSKEEALTATLLQNFIEAKGIKTFRKVNNVWAFNKYYDKNKPTILLNSHHDTVRPNQGYTLNPNEPLVAEGKLFGLGSNDAGGTLVSLLSTFLYFYDSKDSYNFVFVASAEEENSGKNGIEIVLPEIGEIEFAIVGEPTQMHLAIAEKGLLVLDCIAYGKAGHAAREEGENAIYKALKDIHWFQTYQFEKKSATLGPVKMSVTIINAGIHHNMLPDTCKFTVDIRTTDACSNEEVLAIIKSHIDSECVPRSMRLKPSSIALNHPIVKAGIELGRKTYGSLTTSDKAMMNFPSLKLGPGDSARSHTADEFIYIDEIKEGIQIYINLLEAII